MSSTQSPSQDSGSIGQLPPVIITQAEAAARDTKIAEAEPSDFPNPRTGQASQPEHAHAGSSTHSDVTSPAIARADRLESPIEDQPPPAYSSEYGQVDFQQDGFDTRAKVANDGRVNIDINQKSRRLSDLLAPALRSQLGLQQNEEPPVHPAGYIPPAVSGQEPPPTLNVVIHVVGSRGDVQPFVALGKVLKATYKHRVRLATHPTFRAFVEEHGLEFFSIGGDPAELMAFMVKNPGLMPGMDSLKSGDVGKRRKGMYEIVQGCWRSCIEIGDGTGVKASDDVLDSQPAFANSMGMEGDSSARPFVADVIIANPPSFAHIHCAEKLGIPLHLMFTMPWSPTQAFPHPLANIQSSNADTSITNFVSYALVEMMTWQGLGDIINRFREKFLGLEPVSLVWAPGMASRLRIPYTYCWSPALIPKPKDWGSHISISGFFFLSLASNFTPEPGLAAFLKAGPPPVYIGFGSIVIDDPNAMTKLIFEAVKKTGQRALVSKGWGGFGADAVGIPEGIFMLGNVPHDWLFNHVSCVVHHGGAGTTAAGISLGKPTVIVPFFGDQPFWGAMVAKAGAGPLPIPSKQLTAEKLAAAITEALKPSTLSRARELGARIASEKGVDVGAQSFHDKLNVDSLRCAMTPSRSAVWRVKRTNIRLSAFAASVLGNEGLLDFNDLKLYRPREYDSEDGPWDPISGGASALLGTLGSLMMGFADFPVEILRALKIKSSGSATPGETASTSIDDDSSLDLSKSSLDSTIQESRSSHALVESSSLSDAQEFLTDQMPPLEPNPLASTASKGKNCAPRAMASALQTSVSRSPSRSSSPNKTSSHPHPPRSPTNTQNGQISFDAALGAGKGIGRIVGAGLKSPMDFTLGLARGFHNAPKLYGDESVRQADKITGLQSGLKAAGKEFGFGFYDGISGLVTQPLEGAKKEGVAGLIKGFGKGIGGVVLKPGAAIWGIPGYTFKGIYKELQKHLGSSVHNYIVAARTTQGYEEWSKSSREERLGVVSRWQQFQVELAKGKHQARHGNHHGSSGFLKTRHLSFDERKRLAEEKRYLKMNTRVQGTGQTKTLTSPIQPRGALASDGDHDSTDFEAAIKASVAATSKGNPTEDGLIEQAIRASVLELQKASNEGDERDALQRAIQVAARDRTSNSFPQLRAGLDGASDHGKRLEEALQHSIAKESDSPASLDLDDSGVESNDDKNIKAATRNSIPQPSNMSGALSEEDLEKAMATSRQTHEKHQKSKMEEEIVVEYVKKQSLVEDQLKGKGDSKFNAQELHHGGSLGKI